MKMPKLKLNFKRSLAVVLTSAAILALAVVWAAVTKEPKPTANQRQKSSAIDSTPHEQSVTSPADTATSTQASNPSSPVAQGTTPSQPTPSRPSTPPVTPVQPQPTPPFAITGVSLQGTSWQCSGGSIAMYVESATVIANSPRGGSFQWYLEESGSYNPPAPYSQSYTISANQSTAVLKSSTQPGFLYSTGGALAGQSVRVHVTGPNDVVSAWFTIPTGTSC